MSAPGPSPAAMLAQVPAELLLLPNWVAWRTVILRSGKKTKPPLCAATGSKARTNDPDTWGTFQDVAAACANGGRHFDGLGFVLIEKDGYTVIDLDHCRDPETGVIEQWALDIITALASYTEVSPSGTGVHIWIRGKLPATGRKKDAIEMYSDGRYMTVTGARVDGTPATIEGRQQELEALHTQVFGDGAAPLPQQPQPDAGQPAGAASAQANGISDDDLIGKALASKNAKGRYKFKELWQGDWKEAGYRSASEASFSLCRQLSFWGGGATPKE